MFTYKCQMFLHEQDEPVYSGITLEDKTFFDENIKEELQDPIAKYDFETGTLMAMEVAKKVEGKGFELFPNWKGVKDGVTTVIKTYKEQFQSIKVNEWDKIIYTPKTKLSTTWEFELYVEESQILVDTEKKEDNEELMYIPDSDDEVNDPKNGLNELAKAAEEKQAADKKAAEEKEAAEKKAAEEKEAAEKKAAAKKKRAEEKEAEEKRKAEEEAAKIVLIEQQKKDILEHEKQINVIMDCIMEKNKEYIDYLSEKVHDDWGVKKIDACHVWVTKEDKKESFDQQKAGVVKDGAIRTNFLASDITLFPLYQHIAEMHNNRDDVKKNIKTKRKAEDDEEVEVEPKRASKAPRKALAVGKSGASGASHTGGSMAKSARTNMPETLKDMMTKANEDSDESESEEDDEY